MGPFSLGNKNTFLNQNKYEILKMQRLYDEEMRQFESYFSYPKLQGLCHDIPPRLCSCYPLWFGMPTIHTQPFSRTSLLTFLLTLFFLQLTKTALASRKTNSLCPNLHTFFSASSHVFFIIALLSLEYGPIISKLPAKITIGTVANETFNA